MHFRAHQHPPQNSRIFWLHRLQDEEQLYLCLQQKAKVAQLCPTLCNPMDYTDYTTTAAESLTREHGDGRSAGQGEGMLGKLPALRSGAGRRVLQDCN